MSSDSLPFLFELQKTKLVIQKSNNIEEIRDVAINLVDFIVCQQNSFDTHVNEMDLLQNKRIAIAEKTETFISKLESNKSKGLIPWTTLVLIIMLIFGLPMTYQIGANTIAHSQPKQP
jgi:hypothetical protein